MTRVCPCKGDIGNDNVIIHSLIRLSKHNISILKCLSSESIGI